MASDQLGFPTTQEFRDNYAQRGIVKPLYGIFFPSAVEKYPEAMGLAKSFTVESIGDIDAQLVGAFDTESKAIKTDNVEKTFKKEFLKITYKISKYQDKQHVTGLSNRMTDALIKQQDYRMAAGVDNNGLFVSTDANIITENTTEIDTFDDLHALLSAALRKSELYTNNGNKIVLLYGAARDFANRIISGQSDTYRSLLSKQFPGVGFVDVPDHANYNNGIGFEIISEGLVVLKYTKLAGVDEVGYNAEAGYNWINYDFGTMMIDVAQYGALINQPFTIAA